jgi:hypothetical protein
LVIELAYLRRLPRNGRFDIGQHREEQADGVALARIDEMPKLGLRGRKLQCGQDSVLASALFVSLRTPNSNSSTLNRKDGARGYVIGVLFQHELTDRCLLSRREVHDPDNSAMGLPQVHRQIAEVLVDGYEHAAILIRGREYLRVSGVPWPVAAPRHVMAGRFKYRLRAAPDARIEQQPHAPVSNKNGSIRSRATIRRA